MVLRCLPVRRRGTSGSVHRMPDAQHTHDREIKNLSIFFILYQGLSLCFYPEPKDHIEPDRSLACKPAQGPSFATTCNQIRLRLIRLQGEQKVTWAGRTSLFFVNSLAAKKFSHAPNPIPKILGERETPPDPLGGGRD